MSCEGEYNCFFLNLEKSSDLFEKAMEDNGTVVVGEAERVTVVLRVISTGKEDQEEDGDGWEPALCCSQFALMLL